MEIVKLLLDYGADVDYRSLYSLYEKFESYYLARITDKIKFSNNESIRKANIPLHQKISSLSKKSEEKEFSTIFEILKIVFQKININFTFGDKSILDLAVEAGDTKTIEFLLENKIDELEKKDIAISLIMPDVTDETIPNIYELAYAMTNRREKRNVKNQKKDDKPSVSRALERKDIEEFRATITKEIAEFLPVTDLVKEDYSLDFLQISIENGSDINFQDSNGKTALILACEQEKIDIVKYLLSKNIDLNIEDLNLKKAIQYTKNYELVKLFLVSAKRQHNPQKLVKLLQNFTIDKPIKYTTHPWDFGGLKKEYGDFDGYMKAVREQFFGMRDELEELSPNLYKKIYTFLIEEDPDEKYSWCSKTHINIGFSSLKGLKEWCDGGNEPEDFKLTTPISYEEDFETVRITKFKGIIDLFKQEIEIRANFRNLEKLFANQVEKLGENFMVDLTAAKLARQFYTDTEKFSNVLDKIFSDIGTRKEYPNIEVITTELEDRSIEIKITHIDSTSSKSGLELLQRANEAGDISEIKHSLTNLCDWSIESSYGDEHFRVNFLHSNNVKDIEVLTTKPKGFTHILRFY